MAIGPSFYKEEYKNLTLDELKRKLKSCESSFKKLRYKFWDLFIRNCDYSNEANNEAQIIAIKELITEKEKIINKKRLAMLTAFYFSRKL